MNDVTQQRKDNQQTNIIDKSQIYVDNKKDYIMERQSQSRDGDIQQKQGRKSMGIYGNLILNQNDTITID